MSTPDIQNLVASLRKAKDAYYNHKPIMSDADYDALEEQLRKLDPSNKFFSEIGTAAPVGGSWPKVLHQAPMSSLNKVQVQNEFEAWVAKIGNVDLFVSEKMDGSSISLVYKGRRLVQALTRGDGKEGEDITRNVLLMKGAVKMLPATMFGRSTPDLVHVRGEMIITKQDFKRYFVGDSNPRNSANGTAKRQSNAEKCQYLSVVAYNVVPDGFVVHRSDEVAFLRDAGFTTPNFQKIAKSGSVQQLSATVDALYEQYKASKRDALDWEIDGLVVEVDDPVVRDSFGMSDNRPVGATAYKFPHEQAVTKMVGIRWEVGVTGRLTPVAEVEPVWIGGTTVTNISLATVRQMEHLQLGVGTRVRISRRNDVIPRIEENLDLRIVNL